MKIGIGWLVLIFTVVVTIYCNFPPKALDRTAPAEAFSAARARDHILAISQETHPVGTPAHDRVLSYIVEELKKLGITPAIQHTFAGAQTVGINHVSTVSN